MKDTQTPMTVAMATIVLALFIGSLASLVFAYPVMLLWNHALVPAVNGVNPIGFWQAMGIILLSIILIKGNNPKIEK